MDKSEPLDLSQLHLTPDWVKEGSGSKQYADYKVEETKDNRGRGRRDGRDGRDGGGRRDNNRRDNRGGQKRRPSEGKGPGGKSGEGRRDFGDRRERRDRDGDKGQQRRGRPGDRQQRRDQDRGNFKGRRDGRGRDRQGRGRDRDRRDRPPLPAGIVTHFIPSIVGVESLSRQIKATGRAYSVFDLARLVLSGRERYHVEFAKANSAAESLRFFQCKLDQSLWLNKEEALQHAMGSKEFNDFYKSEEKEVDPPKGNFSVIAVCGMSGTLLGPPNYHDYQKDLNRLYKDRFSNMPFEVFKRRIRMENDEETKQKWEAEKSKQTHYIYQKQAEGEEPQVFTTREELERHCRQHHLDDLVGEVDKGNVPGSIPGRALAPPLLAILRRDLEKQKRFPMDTVKLLCRQLEEQGLKFFKDEDEKKRKTTYVCRSRPRALEATSEVSERIRKILNLIRDNTGIDYAMVVSSMLPPGQKPSAKTRPEAPKPEGKPEGKSESPQEATTVEPEKQSAPTEETPPADPKTPASEAAQPSTKESDAPPQADVAPTSNEATAPEDESPATEPEPATAPSSKPESVPPTEEGAGDDSVRGDASQSGSQEPESETVQKEG